MSNIVGKGWTYMPRSQRMHYFIETDERPQIVTSLCGTFSTAPGIARRLSPEEARRPGPHNDCKACRRKLDKHPNAAAADEAR